VLNIQPFCASRLPHGAAQSLHARAPPNFITRFAITLAKIHYMICNYSRTEKACDWKHKEFKTGSPIETPCLNRSKNLDTIIRTRVVSRTAHAASQHLTTGFRVNQNSKPRYSPPPGKCTPNMWSKKRWVARRRTRIAALVATCKRRGETLVLRKKG
jgi:hypothetical protein